MQSYSFQKRYLSKLDRKGETMWEHYYDGPGNDGIRSIDINERPDIYADFTLTADLSSLTDNQKKMISLLIDASQIMDDLYWRQSYGARI